MCYIYTLLYIRLRSIVVNYEKSKVFIDIARCIICTFCFMYKSELHFCIHVPSSNDPLLVDSGCMLLRIR